MTSRCGEAALPLGGGFLLTSNLFFYGAGRDEARIEVGSRLADRKHSERTFRLSAGRPPRRQLGHRLGLGKTGESTHGRHLLHNQHEGPSDDQS